MQGNETANDCLSGIGRHPKKRGIFVPMAVGVLDGNLGFADTSETGDGLGLGERRGVGGLQGAVQGSQNIFTAGEIDVSRVGDVPGGKEVGLTLPGTHRLDLAESRFRGLGLPGEQAKEILIALGGIETVAGDSGHRGRDVLCGQVSEKDRDEPGVHSAWTVDIFANKMSLPQGFPVYPRFFVTHDTFMIGLRTDHEDKVGMLDLRIHPEGPAFRRMGVVLVDNRVDTVSPKTVGEGKDAVGLFG